MAEKTLFDKRNGLFFILSIIALWILYSPLKNLLQSSTHNELYSHIILIPVITAYLIFAKRKALFREPAYSLGVGITLLVVGVTLFLIGKSREPGLSQNDYASIIAFSAVLFWIGSFILLYGVKAFRRAMFPFLFLLFMIPIPWVVMDKIILVLQLGSAKATHLLFLIIGMPFSREGLVFNLPGISIEVAEECSSIRSSLALLITSVLASYLFLQTYWKRAVLVLSVVPVSVFKNGVRVVTLSWLSVHVDEKILTGGFLHRSGGFVFFALGLVILGLILLLLRGLGRPSTAAR